MNYALSLNSIKMNAFLNSILHPISNSTLSTTLLVEPELYSMVEVLTDAGSMLEEVLETAVVIE